MSPQHPKEGDTVTFKATIRNIGQADVTSFRWRYLIDMVASSDQVANYLSKGSTLAGEFKWKAKAGSHTFRIFLDPDNNITEASRANNEAGITFTVAKKEATADFMMPMLVIIIVVVLMAVIAAVMLKRRKKPVTVIQYQPPPAQPALAPPPQPQAPPAMPPSQPPMPPSLPPQAPPPIPPPS
jgi:hypothetical protein